MTSLRPFTMNDLLSFNNVNLDVLTETYHLSFYMSYMVHWPESFVVAVMSPPSRRRTFGCDRSPTYSRHSGSGGDNYSDPSPTTTSTEPNTTTPSSFASPSQHHHHHYHNKIITGYLLGKSEGEGSLWHGHVSAVTVAQSHRRIQMAKFLMAHFEEQCDVQQHNYFVDLFVRTSNALAIQMYHQLGYRVYRRVIGYYQSSSSNNNNSSTDSTKEAPEDAYDMRKSLSRDPQQLSMIPLPHAVYPEDLEW
jgi:N-terminal acetyltransferase B complex catalytic subunit